MSSNKENVEEGGGDPPILKKERTVPVPEAELIKLLRDKIAQVYSIQRPRESDASRKALCDHLLVRSDEHEIPEHAVQLQLDNNGVTVALCVKSSVKGEKATKFRIGVEKYGKAMEGALEAYCNKASNSLDKVKRDFRRSFRLVYHIGASYVDKWLQENPKLVAAAKDRCVQVKQEEEQQQQQQMLAAAPVAPPVVPPVAPPVAVTNQAVGNMISFDSFMSRMASTGNSNISISYTTNTNIQGDYNNSHAAPPAPAQSPGSKPVTQRDLENHTANLLTEQKKLFGEHAAVVDHAIDRTAQESAVKAVAQTMKRRHNDDLVSIPIVESNGSTESPMAAPQRLNFDGEDQMPAAAGFLNPDPMSFDGILQGFVGDALDNPALQARLEYYEKHSSEPINESEELFVVRLSKVKNILMEIRKNENFVADQLSGFTQLPMVVGELHSWSEFTKRLSRTLSFFGVNNRVVVFNEGALMEKGKHDLAPLVLPVAGFAHQANVTFCDVYSTQLTISWFEDSSEDAAAILFSLIQLALASQAHEIVVKGLDPPCRVEVEVPAEGNEAAAMLLSSDQLSRLCKFSGAADPSDHLIEFKKTVFTSQQQDGMLKTAGQIILTDCILEGDGEAISQALELGASGLVLYSLTLRGNLPIGNRQCLRLVESCQKEIVIGKGTAAQIFEQEVLVDRLKEKAATSGIYYHWKFDVDGYSQPEKMQLGEFLGDIYTQKLLLLENSTEFAEVQAQILEQLSNAYDQDDPNGETYEWPCDMVDILPRTLYQVSFASGVKEKLKHLAFVKHRPPVVHQPPARYPPPPIADSIPLSQLFKNEMTVAAGMRKCGLCNLEIEINADKCSWCACICKPDQVNPECSACQETKKGPSSVEGVPKQNPGGSLKAATKEDTEVGMKETNGFSFEASASTNHGDGFSSGNSALVGHSWPLPRRIVETASPLGALPR